MRYLVVCVFLVMCLTMMKPTEAGPSGVDIDDDDNYPGNYVDDNMFHDTEKRACIRRGGNCDHRPNDCCYNSSCRCNLWGSNCRCQRMGLFQKWG